MEARLKILFVLFLLSFTAIANDKTINIYHNKSSTVLNYGVLKFKEEVNKSGYAVYSSDFYALSEGIIIISSLDTLQTELKKMYSDISPTIVNDGYKLLKKDTKIYIIGNSERGCLYGLFDIMEQISFSGDLSKVEEKLINPAVAFRAVKFNLPWSPYRPGPTNDLHIETCKDLKFWEDFLDMCIKNRFNAITLWNNHPFPYLIRATNYPKATPFTDEELLEWQTFYKTLFKMAKDRGLETYIINWNIVVSPEFAKNYGSDEYSFITCVTDSLV